MPNPIILNGQALAEKLQRKMREELATATTKHPKLGVILCSSDPASQVYVNKKIKACETVGIKSHLVTLPETDLTLADISDEVRRLNDDPSIHGILVQLPLPVHLHAVRQRLYDLIDPSKDVDVLNPQNTGLLLQGRPRFYPCTPQAVRVLLQEYGITTKGKAVTIINRSDIVGKPLAAMLVQDEPLGNSTVCICHDNTPPEQLKSICLRSDIIVVAVGIKHFLKADMVAANTVVVDVGINREGKKLYGDVDPEVYPNTLAYSPVPGGVGPLTVTMLMRNTLNACYALQ